MNDSDGIALCKCGASRLAQIIQTEKRLLLAKQRMAVAVVQHLREKYNPRSGVALGH